MVTAQANAEHRRAEFAVSRNRAALTQAKRLMRHRLCASRHRNQR